MLNATTTAGAQLRNLVIIVICIALLAGINVVFNDYIVRVISTIFIFMILAVSYNLINGVITSCRWSRTASWRWAPTSPPC